MAMALKQKEIKEKVLPEIFEFIKSADKIEFEIDKGTDFFVDKRNWRVNFHTGESTITFRLYHKKMNQRKEAAKKKHLERPHEGRR